MDKFLYRACSVEGEILICIKVWHLRSLFLFFSKEVEIFKMKKKNHIEGNLFVHVSISFISISEGLLSNFYVN